MIYINGPDNSNQKTSYITLVKYIISNNNNNNDNNNN